MPPGQQTYTTPAVSASSAFGGRDIVINGLLWTATNWKPEFNTRKARRNDSQGNERHKKILPEPTTQSGLTLQVPRADTPQPFPAGQFTVDGIRYVITKSAIAQPEGEWWTCDLDYESA